MVRKLELMNPDSTFKESISFTHHREPPCHFPYHRAPCFSLCSHYTTLALPLSSHASSVPTGAGDIESTEMLLPPSGARLAGEMGTEFDNDRGGRGLCDEAAWKRSLTQFQADGSQCK